MIWNKVTSARNAAAKDGSEANGIIDKTLPAAAKKNARQTLMRADRHQHRRFDGFDDFVGALRLPKMPGMVLAARADDDEIVLPGRCFAENLRSRLAGLDDGPKLDASLPQNAGLAIESLTQRLVVGWVFRRCRGG